jgi:hypothetical protein
MEYLLIIVGILLFVMGIRKLDFSEKFDNVLNVKQNNLSEYDMKIGEIRKEFAETLIDLQLEVQDLKELIDDDNVKLKNIKDHTKEKYIDERYNNMSSINEKIDNKENIEEINDEILKEEQEYNFPYNDVKINNIKKLMDEGYSIDEICEKLDVGKGEILLIIELFLK